MTLREIFFSLGYEVDKTSETKAEQSIQSLKSTATKLLSAIGIGFSLVQLNAISEEFSRINGQIENATDELMDQAEAQDKILASANATRTGYQESANVIASLVKGNKTLFGDVDEAVAFNNAATMLFKTAGKTNEEVSSLMESINKSFQKGVVDSETINQLLEKSPETVELLNNRLGTTSEQLSEMASSGQMTVEDLKYAFVDNADAIEKSFANVRYNVTDALTNIRNQWGLWVSDMNESLAISETIGTTLVTVFTKVMRVLKAVQTQIEKVTEKLGGTKNMFKLLSIIVASTFGVLSLKHVVSFITTIKTLDKTLIMIKLKMLAIIAAIVLFALIIDDVVSFIQGNDSVIASMFEKAGINAGAIRESIFKIWNSIKQFLTGIWLAIQFAGKEIFGAFASWWNQNGESIANSFNKVWDRIKFFCIITWNFLKATAMTIFGILLAFWNTWGQAVIIIFETLWNTLISSIHLFLDALSSIISFLSNVFTGDFKSAWNDIKDFTETILKFIISIFTSAWIIIFALWSKAYELFLTIFDYIRKAIVKKVVSIKDAIVTGFTAAIDWIKSLPSQAVDWGKDIILGIVDGIKSSIGKIGEAAGAIADKIKSYLGFSEPEYGPLSDFHTYMPDMIDLMSEGIKSGRAKVSNALESITGDISAVANSNIVSPNTLANSGMYGSSSRSVTQHVNITNHFNGDRAGQEKSSSAMDKASSDATSEMARAIAFAK